MTNPRRKFTMTPVSPARSATGSAGRVTAAQTGMAVAAVLAIVWAVLGFWVFIGVAASVLIGGLIGRIVDGELDVSSLVDRLRGKRTSS
jgi:hypothetical protein